MPGEAQVAEFKDIATLYFPRPKLSQHERVGFHSVTDYVVANVEEMVVVGHPVRGGVRFGEESSQHLLRPPLVLQRPIALALAPCGVVVSDRDANRRVVGLDEANNRTGLPSGRRTAASALPDFREEGR